MRFLFVFLFVAILAGACTYPTLVLVDASDASSDASDASSDASDASGDASTDAAADASTDASSDASTDAAAALRQSDHSYYDDWDHGEDAELVPQVDHAGDESAE